MSFVCGAKRREIYAKYGKNVFLKDPISDINKHMHTIVYKSHCNLKNKN